jgi:glycosyltransferase involved in cell wall biosynthesis
MRFSLIVGTKGRTQELTHLLQSLSVQSYKEFEVILVDQNEDDRLQSAFEPFQKKLRLVHLRAETGLSRARNVGLRHAKGEVVAFPDDDCSYPPDLLSTVARILESHPEWDGLSGRCMDELTGVYNRPWRNSRRGQVNRVNVWALVTSVTLFLRRRVTDASGLFDESLGLGSGTQRMSGAEMDFMIGVLQQGFKIHHEPEIIVLHPDLPPPTDHARLERTFNAGRSMGFIMKKRGYPIWIAAWWWIRAAGGTVICAGRLDFTRARLCFTLLRGRMFGWFLDK